MRWSLVLLGFVFFCTNNALYTSRDDVTITTGDELMQSIPNSRSDLLVEYYHRFCGHCIKFAPYFKRFATSIKDWKSLLKVLVLDCANPNNTVACSTANIDGFPSMRYYPKDYKSIRTPYELVHHDDTVPSVDDLVLLVANYSPNVVFKPIENRERRWTLPNRYLLLQGAPKEWSIKTILYFADRSIIPVTWSNQSSSTSTAIVVTLINTPEKQSKVHTIPETSWSNFYNEFKEMLKVWNLWTGALKKKTSQRKGDSESVKLVEKIFQADSESDVVHTSDLYSVLSRIFYNEIPLRIFRYDKEKIDVIQQLLSILIKYFHGTEATMNSLRTIQNVVSKTNVTTRDWPEIVKEAKFPQITDKWITCSGSQPYLRGYPCGLWTLFHSLTVAEWKFARNGGDVKVPGVLPMMRNFILSFFSCKDCAMHFKALSANVVQEAPDARSSVLWLWRAHNRVNQRLEGEPSEDPLHPKVQFPTEDDCPKCRKAGSQSDGDTLWDEDKVLEYLSRRYDSASWTKDPNIP